MGKMATTLLDGRLKFRHLLLVDAITRHGTLVMAADELQITQPAATRTLRELEQMLGVTLFERHARGLAPTPFSEAFSTHARAVLAQVRQAEKHVAELKSADRGELVIGTHLAGGVALLPRAVASIKARHPMLTVVVREGLPSVLLSELEAGLLDLIVGRLTQPSDDVFTRLKLHEEPIRLVVRRDHPLAGAHLEDLGSLSGFPWILPSAETRLRAELEMFFTQHGIELPQNRVETTSYLAVRHLVAQTDAVAAVPEDILAELPGVEVLDVAVDTAGRSLGVTIPATRTLTPAAQAMLLTLRELAASGRGNDGDLPPDGVKP
jgi:DNA-binding transcriptional LysR family regulator